MKKSVKITLGVLIALMVLFIVVWPRWRGTGDSAAAKKPSASDAPPGGAPPGAVVQAVVARAASLDNEVRTTGTVLANEAVEVRSEISGKVTRVYFREGDAVRKGAVLLRLNDDELRADLQRLGYQQQLYEQSEQRQRQLLEREAISQQDYDVALTELNANQADISRLKAQIDKAVIRAPFDGRVGLRYVSEGSYLTPSTLVTNVVDADPAKLEFSLPAKYSQSVRVGDTVQFQVEGTDETFAASIYAFEPRIDATTRTLQVRARCPNPGGALLPGAFANVEVPLRQIDRAILVPTEAVVPELDGHLVYVSRQGVAQPVSVQLGLRLSRFVQIDAGLADGDTVVSAGVQQLRPGTPLNITEVTDVARVARL